MKKSILFFFLLFWAATTLTAQDNNFQKKEFIYKGDTLRYQVLFPKNYDKHTAYPLVLFLHGSGERGSDNEKQLIHGSAQFTDSLNRINYPAIVLFPQCPENESWVTLNEKPDEKFDLITSAQPTKPLGLVKQLVDFYTVNEAVDSKRLYIFGLSLGGMGTFDMICRYPKTFAAAIPICGGVNVERLKAVRKMPIRIYHGGADNVVMPDYSRNAFAKLIAFGSQKVAYKEFPGIGHNSWTAAFAEPDFLKWLFSQRK